MLEFISSLPDFDGDTATQSVWKNVSQQFIMDEGVGYYKHPVLGPRSGTTPELALFVKTAQPIAIRVLPYQIDEINEIQTDYWVVNGKRIDSPIWELDDFRAALRSLIDLDRRLRKRLRANVFLALPLISISQFKTRFAAQDFDVPVLWRGDDFSEVRTPLGQALTDEEWLAFRAVIQTAVPLSKGARHVDDEVGKTLGAAIRTLDRQIKTLDLDQEKIAIQIAPGPQRIRGLAGTGKTVLLAMRAANIHRHFPDAKILFTFHTRSLYNQARQLIEQFYGVHKANLEPDWTKIHIRHSWGGRSRPGVYSDICGKQGVAPLNLNEARARNYAEPFAACCQHALSKHIEPEYDYIIIDEAQDFPKEFFQVLYKLSKPPKRIYWAYDELQSIATNSLEIPGPEELFGIDEGGNPLVELDAEDYPGGIPKDFILSKSYRCPQAVLMTAHAIGLGLYNPAGCVQMLQSEESWQAIGYHIEDGQLQTGKQVTIVRPPENSPNRIGEIYEGKQQLVTVRTFNSREEEFDWVAESINSDIRGEDVAPERIAVIILDSRRVNDLAPQIQRRLVEHGVASTIPGLIEDADTYAEEGRVTISSVFRAKGNEAFIVYVVGFEELYSYVDAIENRNRAFTAISRSKAWVRITGTGSGMIKAQSEVNAILLDIPRFRFVFPSMDNIRNLDAVTQKRRKIRAQADRHATELIKDREQLKAMSPEKREQLRKLLEDLNGEN